MRVWREEKLEAGGVYGLTAEVASFDPLPGETVRNSILRRSRRESSLLARFDLSWFGEPLVPGASPVLVCLATAWVSPGDAARTRIQVHADTTEDDELLLVGQLLWFVKQVGAPLSLSNQTHRDTMVAWNRADPVPGRLHLDDGEAELYAALGESNPFLWEPVRFARWILERPDTVVVGGRAD